MGSVVKAVKTDCEQHECVQQYTSRWGKCTFKDISNYCSSMNSCAATMVISTKYNAGSSY